MLRGIRPGARATCDPAALVADWVWLCVQRGVGAERMEAEKGIDEVQVVTRVAKARSGQDGHSQGRGGLRPVRLAAGQRQR